MPTYFETVHEMPIFDFILKPKLGKLGLPIPPFGIISQIHKKKLGTRLIIIVVFMVDATYQDREVTRKPPYWLY